MVFHVVTLNNKLFKIIKEDTESNDEFFHRCWFIAKKQPNSNKYEEIVSLSKISRNVKFLDVEYSADIMKQIIF